MKTFIVLASLWSLLAFAGEDSEFNFSFDPVTQTCVDGFGRPGYNYYSNHLPCSDFRGVHVQGENWDGFNLEGSRFEGAVLENVSMKRTNLRHTSFKSATLKNVNLEGASF